ncbi:MAG TPA: DUF6644 family protein [Gammaproteobacteria bacterium]|nr:DUF6644 family protein [Gammaproteobacteria bacterium]
MVRSELFESWIHWITATKLSWFVLNYRWVWPISESIHFCGLTLMAGTVGLFDFRLLGFGKGLTPKEVHRGVRWGLVGFAMSLLSGIMFLAGQPDQYLYNEAWWAKVVCLGLMGCNLAAFYSLEFAKVQRLGPEDDAPRLAKAMALTSLLLIAAVICCGRMLTFFRPTFVYTP